MANVKILIINGTETPGENYEVEAERLASGGHIQIAGIDIGNGEIKSKVTASNPMPVTLTSADLSEIAQEATQLDIKSLLTDINNSNADIDLGIDAVNSKLTTLNAKDFATQATLAALNTKVTACDTGAVVISSSALPTGAATETTLAGLNTKIPSAAALSDTLSNPTTPMIGSAGLLYNGSVFTRAREIVAGQNTTGTGVQAAGILGQLDDTATSSVTENQFAPVRISTRRALLVEGVASGTNININTAQINGVAPTMGNGASGTGVQRVTIASDSTGLKSSTATLSNVSASASSVTLVAAKSTRIKCILYNDSTVGCFVKFGTTASSTSFTYRMESKDTLEVEGYTGNITGIWDSATGDMRVTDNG